MRKREIWFWAFLALAAAFSIHLKAGMRSTAANLERVKLNQPAPALRLNDIHGREVVLSETLTANRIVMVNFWATWCKPCRLEMPLLEKIYQKHRKDGLEILAVNVGEEPERVRNYLQKNPVSFPILLDMDRAAAEAYSIEAYPTTVFVARDGTVRRIIRGLDAHLEGSVKYLLKKQHDPGA